jgi:hemolysin D
MLKHAAKLEGIDRQIAGKQAEAYEIEATLDKIKASLPLISEQRDIRKALLGNQYGSRLTYLQTEQQVVEAEHGLEEQKQRLAATNQALAALAKQHAETEADYRKGLLADLAKAETQAMEHGGEIAKAAQKRELRMLKAPVEGTVQQLAIHTIGGIVTPAQQLMVIVPKDAGLEIEANLANKEIGFVHKGQEVEVKIEAFTFTRYGLLHGTVTSLSQDVIAPQDQNFDMHGQSKTDVDAASNEQERQSRQPAYVAHVALSETGIATENGFTPLEPGMAVTAEITTGQGRFISYLLSPLLRYKQEGLRER